MDSIDKQKIQQLVIESSKDSEYYKREMQRTETAKEKAKTLKTKIDTFRKNESLWKKTVAEAKAVLVEEEKERDLTRTWIYIDMDMFYAAVEIRDNPELAKIPIAVGSE